MEQTETRQTNEQKLQELAIAYQMYLSKGLENISKNNVKITAGVLLAVLLAFAFMSNTSSLMVIAVVAIAILSIVFLAERKDVNRASEERNAIEAGNIHAVVARCTDFKKIQETDDDRWVVEAAYVGLDGSDLGTKRSIIPEKQCRNYMGVLHCFVYVEGKLKDTYREDTLLKWEQDQQKRKDEESTKKHRR